MYKKERKKVWPYVARGRVYLATRSHPRRQGWRKKCILSRILDPSLPFYLFPPSSRATSFPPFQPTIASRATDNVISICIYLPPASSIHIRYHFDFSPRFATSQSYSQFPFISLSRPVCSINRELWKKIILSNRIDDDLIELKNESAPLLFSVEQRGGG